MTNVWLIEDFGHGEVDVYDGSKDITEIPFVRDELQYLFGEYEAEREQFLKDVDRAMATGRGEATIEERLRATLTAVRT